MTGLDTEHITGLQAPKLPTPKCDLIVWGQRDFVYIYSFPSQIFARLLQSPAGKGGLRMGLGGTVVAWDPSHHYNPQPYHPPTPSGYRSFLGTAGP